MLKPIAISITDRHRAELAGQEPMERVELRDDRVSSTLLEEFGSEYEAYRRAVPGWWPRLRPWQGSDAAGLTGDLG